ncbi:MAG: hypothetical protein GQ574_02325 [Crocinitomix sp.]|nr:hypothetical protein [Crocinitomix sp.]
MKILIIIFSLGWVFLPENGYERVESKFGYEKIGSDEQIKSTLSIGFFSGFFNDTLIVYKNDRIFWSDIVNTNSSTSFTNKGLKINTGNFLQTDTIRILSTNRKVICSLSPNRNYSYLEIHARPEKWNCNYSNSLIKLE